MLWLNVRLRRWWSSSTAGIAVVVDGGGEGRGARGEGRGGHRREGKASKGERARADEGVWARAMVDMADDNGKQQKGASDNGAACGVALK